MAKFNMNRQYEPHPMDELNHMNPYNVSSFSNFGNEFGQHKSRGGARNQGGRRGSFNNNNNNRNNNMSSSFSVNSFTSNNNNGMNGIDLINNNSINNMSRSISFNSGNSNSRGGGGGQNRSGGNRAGNRYKKKKNFNNNSLNINNNIGSFESNAEIKVSTPLNGPNTRFNNHNHLNSISFMNNSIFEDNELSPCFDANMVNKF